MKTTIFGAICLLVLLTAGCIRPPMLRAPRSNASSQPASDVMAVEANLSEPTDKVEKEANDQLLAKDFRALEASANTARSNKERLPGAYWKIDAIYNGLLEFYAEYKGQRVTDEMWKNRIEILKQWKISMPESITPRVALAAAYIEYGWFARGSGYADSVSREGFAALQERLKLAQQELDDARNIKARCPRWYREMMMIAMAEGWPIEEYEDLYNAAIKSEPNYLQFYLSKSEYLTPKWSGGPDDWQHYVDSLPSKLLTLKEAETDIIYLVVVVNKLREPSLSINWTMIAKDRIRKGFSEIDKKYGVDKFRLNQYAFVSVTSGDYESARQAFERIGDDRDSEVWNEQTFMVMKTLATQGLQKAKELGPQKTGG